MEELNIENMKSNEDVTKLFSVEELGKLLDILSSNDSDAKRQEQFNRLIKGEEK